MVLETSERRERTQICVGCRRGFSNRRQDARYCSAACKQDSYRRRLAARAKEAERAREATRRRADFIASLIG
jgi:hypothetical protein